MWLVVKPATFVLVIPAAGKDAAKKEMRLLNQMSAKQSIWKNIH